MKCDHKFAIVKTLIQKYLYLRFKYYAKLQNQGSLKNIFYFNINCRVLNLDQQYLRGPGSGTESDFENLLYFTGKTHSISRKFTPICMFKNFPNKQPARQYSESMDMQFYFCNDRIGDENNVFGYKTLK